MQTELYVKSGEKRGRILAFKALVIFGTVLCTSLFTRQAAAQVLIASPEIVSTYATSSYTSPSYLYYTQRIELPATTSMYYVGVYFTNRSTGVSECPAVVPSIRVFNAPYDIVGSTTPNTDFPAYYSSGAALGGLQPDGSCVYRLYNGSSGGTPNTTPANIVAGTYDVIITGCGNTCTLNYQMKGWEDAPQTTQLFRRTVGYIGDSSVTPLTGIAMYFVNATSSSYFPPRSTELIDFTPHDGDILPSAAPVNFSLHAYVAPEDIGTVIGVRFTLHNIDQNVLLLNRLSPSDFYILDGFQATTSGDFYYTSGDYTLGDGNYRIEAQLERSYLSGWFVNPFSPINDTQSHQFIVGSSTFLGNLSQNAFSDLQTFFASTSATSTEATSRSCNPLAWDTQLCLSYLFIPSSADMTNTLLGLKDMVLSRVPWGYATRLYNIFTSTATSSLPAFEVNLHLGAGSLPTSTSTLTFDPDDMLSGGAYLAGSITDVTYGKTAREILEPLVKLGIALMVVFIIVGDLLKMGHSDGSSGSQRSGTQRQAAITRKEYTF